MKLTRGRVLLPPVVASVEIPYDIKEECNAQALKGTYK